MRKVLFRTLGTVHGVAGLVMLAAAIYLARAGHLASVGSPHDGAITAGCAFVTLVCLLACGVASWFRPRLAASLAWLAAFAYAVPVVVIASASGVTLIHAFYYSASVRVFAASAMSVLAGPFTNAPSSHPGAIIDNHVVPSTQMLVMTMSKLGLTVEERNLAFRVASNRQQTFERIAFYGSVLVPDTAFAVYGLYNRDIVALGLAFFGLLMFIIWRISASLQSSTLYHSLLSKVAQFESGADG